MGYYLLPRFQEGRTPEDIYGTVGGYYPVGEYDAYYGRNIQQPSAAEQIKDYLFGSRYGKYDNVANPLNYLIQLLNYSNNKNIIQKGPYKGELKPKRSVGSASTKKDRIKSKRDYYSEYFSGGVR